VNYVWVHEDAITLDHPVYLAAGAEAKPIFIWNTEDHDRRDYAFKRRVFLYECAHDLDIPIYVGFPYDVLSALSEGGTIYAAASPDPYIQQVLSDLSRNQDVVVIESPTLANIPANTDMGRFFRFWNRARKTALKPTPDPSHALENSESH